MEKYYLFDNDLTLKAKGLLSIILENNNIDSKEQLLKYTTDGRNSLDKGIKELEAKGYLQIKRKKQKGQSYIFSVYPYTKFLN